jgi:hypothetical protein
MDTWAHAPLRHGARFRQKFTLEDAIGSHAFAPLEAYMRVTNGIPLGCSLLLPVDTVKCVQTLKAETFGWQFRGQHTVQAALKVMVHQHGTVLGCEQEFTREDAIEASMRVTNSISLGSPFLTG